VLESRDVPAIAISFALARARSYLRDLREPATKSRMDLRDQLQQTLGGAYVIEHELKAGGMARVFVAKETALGRRVVVKVLNTEIGQALSAERFAREVRLAASLHHPNIVPLLQTGKARDLLYYTMPFIKGDSLRARLRDETPLGIDQRVAILRDVASALEFAHGEGIVHRDIKPENILLAGNAAVVTDFGIAKALSASMRTDVEAGTTSQGPFTLTATGMTLGTPAYIAPEQAAGESVDHRADIYSWGIVAYEVLSGVHPFADRTGMRQMIAAHLSESATPLCERVTGLPVAATALVMKSLEKDPALRPQSAREIVNTLSHLSYDPAHVRVAWSARSRKIALGALVAGLLLVAAYFGLGRILGASHNAQPQGSLAVLPFFNVGGDTANAYFAAGIADELTSELAKVRGLRVASRTSAFAVRSRGDLDVREIGKRLGVNAVLEGTVRRVAGRLRVSAQLTNANDGLTLWSDTYEREDKDIFAVQDDITRSIIGALRPRLSLSAGLKPDSSVKGPGTENLEAYDLYLRGRYLVERRGKGVEQAVDYFSQAISKDPRFAKAYAELSGALELLPYFSPTPAFSVEARAMAAAASALSLDPNLAEPHAALGLAHMHAFRWRASEDEFRRAIGIDSTSPTARTQYARYLMTLNRVPEALTQFQIARRLDPLAATASVWLSYTLFLAGQRDAALAESKRALELDPDLPTARIFLAIDRALIGHRDEARTILGGALPTTPWNGMSAYVLGKIGDTAEVRRIMAKLDSLPRNTWAINTARAFAYLGIGKPDLALTSLEAAAKARETTPAWMSLSNSDLDPVRGTQRFAAVVSAFKLEDRNLTSEKGARPGP
jgi:TolB-like protein/tRNA A-37 threonylcarbamoyl transferase component Bud32/Tfp pilus assembly protein PilF